MITDLVGLLFPVEVGNGRPEHQRYEEDDRRSLPVGAGEPALTLRYGAHAHAYSRKYLGGVDVS